MKINLFGRCLILGLSAFLLGCETEAPVAAPAAPGTPAAPMPPSTVNTGPAEAVLNITVGPAGSPLPPLDSQRVKSVAPENWKLLPRNSKEYLVGLYFANKGGIPRIVLTATDAEGSVTDEATLSSFVGEVNQELADLELLHQPIAVKIGENYWVRYVRGARFQSQGANRMFLETKRNGRRYTIELLVIDGEVELHGPAAYRIANDMKFLSDETEIDDATEDSEKTEPVTKPEIEAEEKPAEDASEEKSEEETAAE
ncbi:MAG: hypothetical protein ACKVH8_14755 [Pirellulales bacterium]|jgi:hypothetical protein